MPENLRNTPATKKQNDTYNIDKSDPEGKPYSREQMESNQNSGTKVFLYHKEHGAKIFARDDLPEEDKGWQDTPFVNHNNDDEPVGEEAEQTEISVQILREECDKQAIKYDKRWGKEKLMTTLEKANG